MRHRASSPKDDEVAHLEPVARRPDWPRRLRPTALRMSPAIVVGVEVAAEQRRHGGSRTTSPRSPRSSPLLWS